MALPGVLAQRRAGRLLAVADAPYLGKHARWTDAVELAMVRRLRFHPLVYSSSVRRDTADALGWPADRVTLLPLGVEVRAPQPEEGRRFRQEQGISPEDRVVLYTGAAPTKNVPLFLEVAQTVLARFDRGVTFVLIGPQVPPGLPEVQSGRLKVIPWQPSITPALEAADIFLSTADYEGFGLAITEAMHTGVPVVSTAVGGVVDQIIDGVTGLLAPPREAQSLADHTCSLLADDDLRRRMGSAARARVAEHFTATRVVDDLEQLYLQLAARTRPHASPSRLLTGDG